MIKRKLVENLCVYALALGIIVTGIAPVTTYAVNRVTAQATATGLVTVKTEKGIANFNRSGGGSISIVGNGGQTLVGKRFNVYKLFNAENSKGLESINYTMNPTYAAALKEVVGARLNKQADKVTEYEIIDYIQTLNTYKIEGAQATQKLEGSYSAFRTFIEELRTKIVDLGIKSDVVNVVDTRDDNSINITGLEFGYYVVDEVSALGGTHSAGSLCMVDTANPTASINIKSDYPTIIKKIQEDDNRDAIHADGWNDIGDYEIGQTVPYKFTSTTLNMNGYDTYYYAWRDVMDPALTFNKDSVGISISDGKKAYTLKGNEFSVITEGLKNGDTFNVAIQDIKAIIDREFNGGNSKAENTYGQIVTLTYNATLNDNAVVRTGRPGFENDVKLVFSNDADGNGTGSRGETPWDTVVCFTDKVNGLKVNTHNTSLKGAKFRLYSDKDCKNEVFVKKVSNDYVVINRDSVGGTDHTGGTVPKEAVEMVSDEKGVFNIIGIDGGTYYLKETEAPAGYRKIENTIVIKIVPTFSENRNSYVKGDGATDKTLKTLIAEAKITQFLDGLLKGNPQVLATNVADGSSNITVVNKEGTKLPITGSSDTVLLLGLGSILMIGALVMYKKKLNVSEE